MTKEELRIKQFAKKVRSLVAALSVELSHILDLEERVLIILAALQTQEANSILNGDPE